MTNEGWQTAADIAVCNYDPVEHRLSNLALAMVIPWCDGWPRYWLDDTNVEQRMQEILAATDEEKFPWEL